MENEVVTAPEVVETPAPEAKPEEVAPRTYTQEDLDRITAKVKKNERYRTRKEVEAYYQGRESVTPAPKPEIVVTDQAPQRDKFANDVEYLEARADFAAKRAAREEREKVEKEFTERRNTESRTKTLTDFQSKVREKFPDIEERIEAIGEIKMPNGMGDAIAESGLGPEIMNHFADNPKDLERIAALSPSAAIREVGKLEARLEAQPVKTTTKAAPSKAPEPITPVGGKGTKVDDEPSHTDPDAWKAWRDRQVQARRTGAR